MSEIVVLYDGQCDLCKNSIGWIKKKLEINAVDFHITNLSPFNVTMDQCSREVFVITDQNRLRGAQAVAFLLKRRGNRISSALITLSGPIAPLVYRWVARNRSSLLGSILSRFLKR